MKPVLTTYSGFGFGQFATILFNMPFGVVQIVATIGGAWLATWLKKKSPVLILLCIPPIIGIIILMVVGRGDSNKGVLLFGYYLVSHCFFETERSTLTSPDVILPRNISAHLFLVRPEYWRRHEA